MSDPKSRSARIAALNDAFRSTFQGGQVLITRGIRSLLEPVQWAVLAKVQTFAAFSNDNDPYGEHDFGRFEYRPSDGAALTILWKIDYYDPTLTFGSEDPADPALTVRVMTIMLGEEY